MSQNKDHQPTDAVHVAHLVNSQVAGTRDELRRNVLPRTVVPQYLQESPVQEQQRHLDSFHRNQPPANQAHDKRPEGGFSRPGLGDNLDLITRNLADDQYFGGMRWRDADDRTLTTGDGTPDTVALPVELTPTYGIELGVEAETRLPDSLDGGHGYHFTKVGTELLYGVRLYAAHENTERVTVWRVTGEVVLVEVDLAAGLRSWNEALLGTPVELLDGEAYVITTHAATERPVIGGTLQAMGVVVDTTRMADVKLAQSYQAEQEFPQLIDGPGVRGVPDLIFMAPVPHPWPTPHHQ